MTEADISKITDNYKKSQKIGPGAQMASDFMTEKFVILFPENFADFAKVFEKERVVSVIRFKQIFWGTQNYLFGYLCGSNMR